jgi:flagellar basal body P-ring protein FlgI
MRLSICVGLAVISAAWGCSSERWQALFDSERSKSRSSAEKGEMTPDEIVEANLTKVNMNRRLANLERVMEGTVGSVTSIDYLQPWQVSGYALVGGLGKNGSKEAPVNVRSEILDKIGKRPYLYTPIGAGRKTAKDLFFSLDTAVVRVTGEIPPAAPVGYVFDVEVQAIENSGTLSLEGGVLMQAELTAKRFSGIGQGSIQIPSDELARAIGPVFVNMVGRSEQAATPSDPRAGKVIGGGINLHRRKIRMVLLSPGYALARRVQSVINSQYPSDPPVADAVSPQQIMLNIPEEYEDRPKRFLALIMHLHLEDLPGYLEQRARDLAEMILEVEAPFEDILLCWQNLGRTILPVVQDLYDHENFAAAYYTSVAGARLADPLALDRLAEFARDPGSVFRQQAIDEMGELKFNPNLVRSLRPLLEDSDDQIRILAYKALRKLGDSSVHSIFLDGGKFWLDIVETKGDPLIYVSLNRSPRIVVFNSDLAARPPILFRTHPIKKPSTLVLTAGEKEETIAALRRDRLSGRLRPVLKLPFNVAELVAAIGESDASRGRKGPTGLGLDLSYAVAAVQSLCESKAIDAPFVLEKFKVSDIFGPEAPVGPAAAEEETVAAANP